MRDITARFMSATGGGRGGRQGGGGGGAAPDAKFYTDWLAALKTLDFDKLSRNAQVDYLTIRASRRPVSVARRQDDSAGTAAQGRTTSICAARRADAKGSSTICRTR